PAPRSSQRGTTRAPSGRRSRQQQAPPRRSSHWRHACPPVREPKRPVARGPRRVRVRARYSFFRQLAFEQLEPILPPEELAAFEMIGRGTEDTPRERFIGIAVVQ